MLSMKIYCLVLICLATVLHTIKLMKDLESKDGSKIIAALIVVSSYILGIVFMAKIL